MNKLLLDERYAPITSEMGFLEISAVDARDAFVNWQIGIANEGMQVRCREVAGSLSERLESLLPLLSIDRRRALLLPTRGRWTAYVDNGWRGTDASPVMRFLSRTVGCTGLRAVSIDNTITSEKLGGRGRHGARILDVYRPGDVGHSHTQRSIFAVNDGGRWVFDAAGTPFPFEDTGAYEARKVRDRFTHEMLDRYLRELGIRMFDEDFYQTDEPAYLVERHGPKYPGMREYTLEEARADW